MIDIFTAEALGGDKVAASYALFPRVARGFVYARMNSQSVHCASTFRSIVHFQKRMERASVNVTTISSMCSRFALQSLCPATACLSVDVPSANARTWVPKKDYDRNRLRAWTFTARGRYRLCLGRNEITTVFSQKTGVKNARAVKDIIQMQKAEYDFD